MLLAAEYTHDQPYSHPTDSIWWNWLMETGDTDVEGQCRRGRQNPTFDRPVLKRQWGFRQILVHRIKD
jgi:hypothetical protein